ncbi:thiamine pyrophosphate-binding protein [Jeotgalibacillus sp. ET6]|uniref:thiamine pyrophosphate-binding protein n=1 Tax=Jeotgalibacillus sp. ET6 TaxID=3037260 RepID=UPI0024183B9F|nr:thiamine pyrophosphate-binding protein [Jeotgalibacillus sp. ET6]MDG5470452.1 thiamine pyrophosphate-binding protein [Jeotgalibacillus sp. ET6]
MKTAGHIIDFLIKGNVDYLFGIPAGSVNAIFDELYEKPQITPVVAKHEGAASFMAAAYAKYSGKLGVVVGCSGPGAMNLVTGAANAAREQIPLLILTGSVPLSTLGWNASQELNASPVFKQVTKYSATVTESSNLVEELHKAVSIAFEGVPGPVHLALPIDVQLQTADDVTLPDFPVYVPHEAPFEEIKSLSDLILNKKGVLFIGNGARECTEEVIELAEALKWPFVTTPQAKGLIPMNHPLHKGVYGFAGHSAAVDLVHHGDHDILFIIGSSLGETATSNYQDQLTEGRTVVQIDRDPSVFTRKYVIDHPVTGDCRKTVKQLLQLQPESQPVSFNLTEDIQSAEELHYDTKTVLPLIQSMMPSDTKYAVDIGEFMSYVIHYMKVLSPKSFDINVHYGSMGTGIGSSIGMAFAERDRTVACITGDGCFFMHGMEILTAKEYNLPITFIVINNSRLGMVHHGHSLQYKRVHNRFSQSYTSISAIVEAINIPFHTISSLEDIDSAAIDELVKLDGPKLIEINLIDDAVPPMGDRVKFLSSFAK